MKNIKSITVGLAVFITAIAVVVFRLSTEPVAAQNVKQISTLPHLVNTDWHYVATSLDDQRIVVQPQTEMSIHFAADRAHGHAGCNHFFIAYQQALEKMVFAQAGSTRMACQDRIMQQEHRFLQNLSAVHSFDYSNGHLMLYFDENSALIFEPLPVPKNE